MKRFAKIVGTLSLLLTALYIVVGNFSEVATRYACSGEMSPGAEQPSELYLELHRYRWWIGLWSQWDGRLWVESPDGGIEHFGGVAEVAITLQIADFDGTPKGTFYPLSGRIYIQMLNGVFEGTCTPIQ